MADEWRPFSLYTSTRPTRQYAWPTGSVKPIDADDQAPIPLLVAIALALFIGFVIIVICICRRHNLLGGASSPQDSSLAYQRAPTVEGGGGVGGLNVGVGGNAYPMMSVKPMYPPPSQGQPAMGVSGKVPGGLTMPPPPPPPQPPHPYPSLPPDAYSPPYPLGYAPLPSYMPTCQSSHTSSVSGPSSGPSSDNAPSAPPPPPPDPGADTPVASTCGSGPQVKGEESEFGGVQGQGQGQMWYGAQGQGVQGYPPSLVGVGMGRGAQEMEVGSSRGGWGAGPYHLGMHPTAMDYMPGAGGSIRVESPHPPSDTIVRQLDQL